MSLNAKKLTCIRIGPRFNANCCNIVTRDGRKLAWTNVVRYLGIFIESASCFKCSLDQGFSICGPRTPGGPRGASRGSAGNPRKTGDPSHFN